MTFTEAAIEVLRREGKPLHFKKIAEIAARENLLDHVGKVPEETMADQLAAHCRLPHPDRRLWAVQQGTFALAEWGLDEDPQGLESLIELPPEGELPYRGRERHPIPSRELARATGRGEREGRARRREEGEERKKRFPPPAEVAYEILAGAARPLTLVEIATQGAERMLMPDAFVRDHAALSSALTEDNRRRESAGRRALFQLEGDAVTLIAQPEPGERPAPAPARAAVAPGEVRRAALAALRRRLRECDAATVEHVAARMLEKLGFRELKVAKRGREHVIYTGRRKLGLGEVRHGIRILRSGADVARRDVTDLRRDLGHYGAQIGVVVSAGDAARDARGDASAAGQLPVLLLCGEALAEALAEAGIGCVPVVVPEVDEAFFMAAAEAAEKEESARLARREERERKEGGERREERERKEGGERERRERRGERAPAAVEAVPVSSDETAEVRAEPEAPAESGPSIVVVAAELPPESPAVVATEVAGSDEDADEGPEGDEGEEGEESEGEVEAGAATPGAAGAEPSAGERRRRRRRRRRRGGRGRGREGAAAAGTPPAEGAPAAPATGGEAPPAQQAEAPAAAEPRREPPPLPPPLPGDGSDGG